MTHLQEHWEGASLSGDYTLEQWLGGDENAAFFQTSFARDGRRAVVKLVPEATAGESGLLDLWHRTRQLRHPNLVELLDCGLADHGGETAIFAVFESPDDTLAFGLSRSPLNREEAREVLDSVIDALRYLHAQGLVLGALDPDHIVAVGEQVKLSTDALREADTSAAYRNDVRLLGELWRQALMPASAKSVEIAAHAGDPDPEARWTLAEISAALEPPLPAEPPPAPAIVSSAPPEPIASADPAPMAPVPIPPVSMASAPIPPAPAPPVAVRNTAPAPPQYQWRASERGTSSRFPKWIFVGAAGVLFLILALNRPRTVDVTAKSQAAPVASAVETPAPVPRAVAPAVKVPAESKSSPAAGEVWRVIAFTYRTHEAAAKKAQQINENHPGLDAAVFTPQGKRGYYLVALGGRMTYAEAVRLQRSARGKALPRDLYVQNYSR